MKPWLVLVALVCCAMCRGGAVPDKPPKQDLSWKRYIDSEQGYCLRYPSRWIREEATDGSGVSFRTGVQRYSMPTGEIDITALDPSEDPVALVQAHLEGMRKFARADNIALVDRHELMLDGSPALFTKDQYSDPLEKEDWAEEMILARHNGRLYRLEMVCRADQIARFDAMFESLVRSFAFDCNAKH